MTATSGYTPPPTQAMAIAQNTPAALKLLIAQRRLYSRAKRWSFLRWIGLSVIGVGAPIFTIALPSSAVAVGALGGAWVFMSRVWFSSAEQSLAAKAAAIQEDFDQLIFGMPSLALRSPRATPEEIAELSGQESLVHGTADKEKLKDWYPFDLQLSGADSVAIAQRANAAYSERLQRANAKTWLLITVIWAAAAILVSLLSELELSNFLLGVVLPLLPALLDVLEQWRNTRKAGADRRAMADGIEQSVKGQTVSPPTGDDLLVWQEQLYSLRRGAPQVPNLVYRGTRKKNERVMQDAASALGNAARARVSGSSS